MVFERKLSSLLLQELRTRGSGTEGPQGSTEAAAKVARGLTPRRVRTRGNASAIREVIPGLSLMLCAVDSDSRTAVVGGKPKEIEWILDWARTDNTYSRG